LKGNKYPYVILSAAMSIDGKIASIKGDTDLSDEQDWKEVHKLRTQVDGIIVGKNTILNDNPKLHVKFYEHKGYFRIIVDSNLSIPIDSNVITFQPNIYPTIICTTENASSEKIKNFESKGVNVLRCGKNKKVNISNLMPILYNLGIHKLLLEGGGTLNWSFIKKNLVDEIRLTIAPWIIGGKEATSLVEGKGFEMMVEAPRFKLLEISSRDNYVTLKYCKSK
jgi:2,5-diamino-6-(ribosylamino)-4(3H)-pyrimidinone 5'-phosphate reductase